MTKEGRAFCLQRLSDAPDLAALQRVWESFGVDPKRDAAVVAHKDQMKEALSREA